MMAPRATAVMTADKATDGEASDLNGNSFRRLSRSFNADAASSFVGFSGIVGRLRADTIIAFINAS